MRTITIKMSLDVLHSLLHMNQYGLNSRREQIPLTVMIKDLRLKVTDPTNISANDIIQGQEIKSSKDLRYTYTSF